MILKQGREFRRAIAHLREHDPSQLVEQLLLVAGSATAFVAFAFDWVWPFGFLAVLFGMGHALCWLVRETVAPGPRGALHRLWALLSFGALLSVLLYLVECHLELYG